MCNNECDNCTVMGCIKRNEAVTVREMEKVFDEIGTAGTVLYAVIDGKTVLMTTLN